MSDVGGIEEGGEGGEGGGHGDDYRGAKVQIGLRPVQRCKD
jgi:hypothetical protein